MLATLNILPSNFCQRRARVDQCLICPREHSSDIRQYEVAAGFQDNKYILKELLSFENYSEECVLPHALIL